ncbi:MAG: hypothetical protein AAF542_06560 [Pseudomonadota bacterium]
MENKTHFLVDTLKHKGILVVLSAYLAAAWVLLQVAIAIETTLALPNWVDRVTLFALATGLPFVLLYALLRKDNRLDSSSTIDHASVTPSVALLPFESTDELTEVSAKTDLGDGLLAVLGRADELCVTNAADGEKLDTDFNLTGRLSVNADHMRFSIQLQNNRTKRHLWSDNYTVDPNPASGERNDLLRKIAMQVCAEITRAQGESAQRRDIAELDAEECYQRGKAQIMFKGWSPSNVKQSSDLFREAIRKQPEFAKAHAMLALTLGLGQKFSYFRGTEEVIHESLAAGKKALQLAPDSSEVLGYVGCAYSDLGKQAMGLPILDKAIELDKANAQAYAALGAAKIVTHSVDEGVSDLEKAIDLLPINTGNAFWKTALASGYLLQGRLNDTLAMAQQAVKDDVSFYPAWVTRAITLALQGENEAAKDAFQQALDFHPGLDQEEVEGFAGRSSLQVLQAAGIWA